MADRIVFQSGKAKPEDKAVLRQFRECGNDADMDSINGVSYVLSAEGKIEKLAPVIYQFYFRNKDNAVSASFPLRFFMWNKPAA